MIVAYKKKTTISGVVFLTACIATALVARAANPRDPGLAMKVAPVLAGVSVLALVSTIWFYIKGKGRSGWWILLLPVYFVSLPIIAFLPDRGTAGDEKAARPPKWSRVLSHIIWSSAQLFVALAAVFYIYLGWWWWEGRQLQSLCAEANEGAPVASLPELVEKYGFSRSWVKHGLPERDGRTWVVYVPSSATMGDVTCAIHYNETKVVSARMQ